jgi:predicted transcriptional regulator
MSVILSIKPKYCDEIRKGNKRYEFRKRNFTREVKYAFVYSTSPVKSIVGVLQIASVIEDDPKKLWEQCRNLSGVSKEEFFEYFRENEKGVAIKIDQAAMFDPIEPNQLFHDFCPPQSYTYVKTPFCMEQK